MAYPKTVEEFVEKLKFAASIPTMYWNEYPYNLGYMHEDGVVSWDCVNLVKSILNGWEYSKKVGSFCNDFSRTGDCTEWGLLNQCSDISTDFGRLNYVAVLYMEGHIGTYVEEFEKDGYIYNVIECTGSWGGGVKCSYVNGTGGRFKYKGGSRNGTWTHHGKMTKWLSYAPLNGWRKISDKWYYYENGKKKTGWLKDDGKWYYLDSAGVMQTGWQKVKGYWYYMNSKGVMQTGWIKLKGYWYYLRGGDSGRMLTGWQKIDGHWYYLRTGDSGRMLTGWQKIKNKWYYLNPKNGIMQTGWLKLGKKTYYLDKNGAMVTGKHKIDGKEYTFNEDGLLVN